VSKKTRLENGGQRQVRQRTLIDLKSTPVISKQRVDELIVNHIVKLVSH
jgi:hypothetical protein